MEVNKTTAHVREVNRRNPVIPKADYLITVGWIEKQMKHNLNDDNSI